VQHTGKLQPKPRLLETVVEEPEPHYSAGDTGYFPMGTNESEFMANVESRNGFSTYEDLQEEELNIPEAPRETVRLANWVAFLRSSFKVSKFVNRFCL